MQLESNPPIDSRQFGDSLSNASTTPPQEPVTINGAVIAWARWPTDSHSPRQISSVLDLNSTELELISRALPGGPENLRDVCHLSSLQEGMLFQHLLDEDRDPHILSSLFQLQSAEHAAALIEALQTVIARHETLRGAILWEELPHPIFVIAHATELPVEEASFPSEVETLNHL